MKHRNNIFKILFVAIIFICSPRVAHAQRVSVSTNALSWANLGTINLEGSVSVSKHFTVLAGAKYNPWKLRTKSQYVLINQQATGYVGAKYWPWHVYSGWWIGAKAQFQNFTEAGLFSENMVKGNALGAGISAGYSIMIGSHVNIDFGIGGWGGRVLKYDLYTNHYDNEKISSGAKNFVFIDNVIVAIAYIF